MKSSTWSIARRLHGTAWVMALVLAAGVPARAQMGDPAVGPTTIPNQDLDPTRTPGILTLESTLHQPLPEQYIWTKADEVPNDAIAAASWVSESGSNLTAHYFRRSFEIDGSPHQATLYLAGPRSAVIYLNGQKVGSYQLNLDFPIGIQVYACDVSSTLRSGKNVLAIEAVRGPQIGSGADNRLSIQQTQGDVLAVKILPAAPSIDAAPLLISDAQWKATLQAPEGWQSASFDDSNWPAADSLGGIESSIEFFQWNADAGMYAWPGYDGISPFLAQYHLSPVKVNHDFGGVGSLDGVTSLLSSAPAAKEFSVRLPEAEVNEQAAPRSCLISGARLQDGCNCS